MTIDNILNYMTKISWHVWDIFVSILIRTIKMHIAQEVNLRVKKKKKCGIPLPETLKQISPEGVPLVPPNKLKIQNVKNTKFIQNRQGH